MVGKVIGIILLIGLCAFIVYEVIGIVRALIKKRRKKKSTTINVEDDTKHGESE